MLSTFVFNLHTVYERYLVQSWLFLLIFHIHKLKFGKKEKPLEVEAVAPQEVIAPMAEETAIAEETSDKEPVQESLPIEIHITSQHHQKRKASYEEMQKQEMEQRVRMVMEYIHYIMPRIADQETINYICTEVHNWMYNSNYKPNQSREDLPSRLRVYHSVIWCGTLLLVS